MSKLGFFFAVFWGMLWHVFSLGVRSKNIKENQLKFDSIKRIRTTTSFASIHFRDAHFKRSEQGIKYRQSHRDQEDRFIMRTNLIGDRPNWFSKKISTKTKTTWVNCLATIWICKQTQNNRPLPSLNIIRNCFGSRSLIKEFRKYIIEFYDSLTCSMKQHSILQMNHVWNMKWTIYVKQVVVKSDCFLHMWCKTHSGQWKRKCANLSWHPARWFRTDFLSTTDSNSALKVWS